MRQVILLFATAIAAVMFSQPTLARPPADLADFVGARAGQAEMGIQNLGYVFDHSHGLTSFWWNGRVCVSIVTSQGRYQSIDRVSRDHCVSQPSAGGGSSAGSGPQDPNDMMATCTQYEAARFSTRPRNIEVKYEGQRVDGTHAVNGTYYSNRGERTFQCSFNRSGTRVVRWVVN